jgi:hypothetical protein
MDLEEYAKDQLTHVYARITADQGTRNSIRGWCITVWIGSIAAVSSSRLAIVPGLKSVLPILPIVWFWLLDAMYQTYIFHHITNAKRLEEMLIGLRTITSEELRNTSLASSGGSAPFRERITLLLRFVFLYKNQEHLSVLRHAHSHNGSLLLCFLKIWSRTGDGYIFYASQCAGTLRSPPVICFGSSSFRIASNVGEMSRSDPSLRSR